MIARISAWFRKIRRWLSRSEWAVRLLRLPRSKDTEAEPGLVLIQIDGLSRPQLENAIGHGRMPSLSRLVETERYQLHSLYSGLPSSTPAVQGELFYGEKCAVPAFSFRDPRSGELVRMYQPDPALNVEQRLDKSGTSLLRGGSAYCDIYSGGANEAHFCASTTGWGGLLTARNAASILGLLLWHGWSLVRVAALMVIEIGLAIVDCVRGLIAGRDLRKELFFVPARVATVILMRELIAIGACMDVARGLPVVHLNLLGYDEHAHRRGPTSWFAHWTLKGIDGTIKRIWRAARRSARRDYEVWIYSDHGQEETVPYEREFGRSLNEAVREAVGQVCHLPASSGTGECCGLASEPAAKSIQLQRSTWLGTGRTARLLSHGANGNGASSPIVADMGPLAHVYLGERLPAAMRDELATRLVEDTGVPLVFVADSPYRATAFTPRGSFVLPDAAAEVFGHSHPFLEEVGRDIVELCHHESSGQFVLSGWRPAGKPISFPIESGAHAGPGPEETHAFALLPVDVFRRAHGEEKARSYLRPLDLRALALHALGRDDSRIRADSVPQIVRSPTTSATPDTLRILTYNVHACVGMDGMLSPARIARVIAQCDADVVALQELDVRRPRTGDVDQAHAIAHELEMDYHFHPAWQVEEESYGDAILSRHAMRLVHSGRLPSIERIWPFRTGQTREPRRLLEPRGAMWVELTLGDWQLQLINTHLGLFRRERSVQVDALLGSEWLAHRDCRDPVILCGDFNATPKTREYRRLCHHLCDAQLELNGHAPRSTWLSQSPLRQIDHVLVSPAIEVRRIDVPRTELARMASDHLPLLVEVRVADAHQQDRAAHLA
jgi:endonuclease/exonuclease/phosphatase family metal-dependent hydrolase